LLPPPANIYSKVSKQDEGKVLQSLAFTTLRYMTDDSCDQHGWTLDGIKFRINRVVDSLAAEDQQVNSDVDTTAYWKSLVYMYLRWSLAGGKPGPPVGEMMSILGKETCLKRLENAKEWATAQQNISSELSARS
jgi:hypothetical protein